jgi:hypothetical protein
MKIHIGCAIKGCPSVYHTDDTPSPKGVRYVCSHHTNRELRAAGILKTDRTDEYVHFQTIAFDKELDGRITIEGGENAKRANGHWMHKLPERPDLYTSSWTVNIESNEEIEAPTTEMMNK